LFGGNTPAICTYLIHITGNKAMPGVWMSAAALIGLVAALMADGRRLGPGEVEIARSTSLCRDLKTQRLFDQDFEGQPFSEEWLALSALVRMLSA